MTRKQKEERSAAARLIATLAGGLAALAEAQKTMAAAVIDLDRTGRNTERGIIEALILFGVLLDGAGLVDRGELAAKFRGLVEHQRSDAPAEEFAARSAAAATLAHFFSAPAPPAGHGLTVINGGLAG